MNKAISGFSKLSKEEKIKWIANEYFSTPTDAVALLKNYWNSDEKLQQLHDEFIENTITNFYIPLELPLIFSLTENTAPFHGH
jgi:hydroxymethylglutaryl-CoA reductase